MTTTASTAAAITVGHPSSVACCANFCCGCAVEAALFKRPSQVCNRKCRPCPLQTARMAGRQLIAALSCAGELLLCDGCPSVFHPACCGLDGVPSGALCCLEMSSLGRQGSRGLVERSGLHLKLIPPPALPQVTGTAQYVLTAALPALANVTGGGGSSQQQKQGGAAMVGTTGPTSRRQLERQVAGSSGRLPRSSRESCSAATPPMTAGRRVAGTPPRSTCSDRGSSKCTSSMGRGRRSAWDSACLPTSRRACGSYPHVMFEC